MHMLKSLLLAAAAVVAMPACAAEPAASDGAATPLKVGALEVVSLKDTQFVMPNDAKVFGLGQDPAAIAAVLTAAGAPADTITLSVDALLVKDGARLILIDTGVGGQLQASLAKAGFAAADITDVLITHSHGDHVGGLLSADGKPAFTNAKVRLSAPEWASMQGNAGSAALVAAITPQVETFAPGSQISPSVRAVPIEGHTPGHTAYEIASDGKRMLAIGDSAHSSIISLAKPEWNIQFDGDADVARASRRALLTRLAAEQMLVFSPHFPYPGFGTVTVKGDGFAWQPVTLP